MKWEDREESKNVEDRRGVSAAGVAAGGGGLLVVIIFLAAQFLGLDPQQAKQIAVVAEKVIPQGQQQPADPNRPKDPIEEQKAKFSRIIFKDTEVVWGDLFQRMGQRYDQPTLVLFSGYVTSACGGADAAVGPFYCPGDSKVYIDLSFYDDMARKLNAPGDFAKAYVIAHEVGHHVQRLLGYSARVNKIRAMGNQVETNKASVRLELQADYLAGVWAHHAQKRYNFLEPGDIESALQAAFEIGDDRLQKKARGTVVPDSFTHGTSAQRQRWFMQGFKTGYVDGARQLFDLNYNQL